MTLRLSLAAAILCTIVCGPRARAGLPNDVEGLRINQFQFIGTHNSYHVRAKPSRFVSLNYSHAPLDVQLERGVRSFELDLHDRGGTFEVCHIVKIDEGTTCRRLSDGLETVRQWSDVHPGHLPISFLFELKKDGIGFDPRIRKFDAASLDRLDDLLQSVFPASRCIMTTSGATPPRCEKRLRNTAGRRWLPAGARCFLSCTTTAHCVTHTSRGTPRCGPV